MTAPSTYFKVFGDWKRFTKMYHKVEGAWKGVPRAYVKVAGAWKLIHQEAAAGPDFGFAVYHSSNAVGSPVAANGIAWLVIGGQEVDVWIDGDDTGPTDTFGGTGVFPSPTVGRIAATGTGLLVLVDTSDTLTVVNLTSGAIVDSASLTSIQSNLLACEDGCVYMVGNDGMLLKVNSAGTISILNGSFGTAFTNVRLANFSSDQMYGYYPSTGALKTYDLADGSELSSSSTLTGYGQVALAGDGSVFGLKVSAGGVASRVYRNGTLVWTGANTSGYALTLARNWATGGIVVAEKDLIVSISSDGGTIDEVAVVAPATNAKFNAVISHPAFPATLVVTTTTGGTPGSDTYLALLHSA